MLTSVCTQQALNALASSIGVAMMYTTVGGAVVDAADHVGLDEEVKQLNCPHCSYVAPYPSAMSKHVRLHSGKFVSKFPTNTHPLCQGEKPFKCEQCDYATAFMVSLKTHMRMHTGWYVGYHLPNLSFSSQEKSRLFASSAGLQARSLGI